MNDDTSLRYFSSFLTSTLLQPTPPPITMINEGCDDSFYEGGLAQSVIEQRLCAPLLDVYDRLATALSALWPLLTELLTPWALRCTVHGQIVIYARPSDFLNLS